MDNPFLDRSFQIPWSQHTAERVEPAIEAALADAEAALARLAALPIAAADYRNTFLALEQATELLNEAWAKVTHLTSVADAAPLRAAHNAVLPKVSAFFAKIPLNAGIWLRLKAAAAHPSVASLQGEHRRFVDETMADFRQQGADLPGEQKTRLEAVQSELAQLTQKYSENVLDATNAWELLVADPARLSGLPPHARESARQNALKKGQGTEAAPVWRFTLHGPSLEPVMLYAEDAQLAPLWSSAVQTEAMAGAVDPGNGRGGTATGKLIASLMAGADGARVAMVETTGWDTHINQEGRLGNVLKGIDEMIAALRTDLGPAWSKTVILVATEFGRTVHVNGTRGTDHGTASAAMLFGGSLAKGGRINADWPGLAAGQLYESRDLKATMRFEALVTEALSAHYGIEPERFRRTVFPDYA